MEENIIMWLWQEIPKLIYLLNAEEYKKTLCKQ